ncbi:MAG: protein kinase [Desulfofustis sp.]|nr:protein kinase [Desulfofustis sp.]
MGMVKPMQFGEKYLLLDQIGAGGVAEVFRGKLTRDKGFEKLIVIKKLLAEHNSDREMVNIFIREARLAALLQHENIATTYDFGEIDGEYFLAMEYLFGKNLHSVMVRARQQADLFGLSEALVIGSKICEGMEYAHNLTDLQHKPLNIVHRDLTPHNIFITYEGKVKILDFGVAQAELFDNKTREGVVKGKISYMSPERLSGEDVDCRSDIFSIGILLYEMIARRRMYQGDTAELIRKCLTADYDNLKNIQPQFDPAVYHILDKALAVEIDRRYQSCAQMQSDIDELLFQMQQRGRYQLLKGAIRGLFAEEYDAEHKKVAGILSMNAELKDQHDKTDIAIVRDRRMNDSEAVDDKTSMLLHRPPAHLAKLYWSRLRAWGEVLFEVISSSVVRNRFVIPMAVAATVLVVLLIITLFLSPDKQEESTPASVTQQAGEESVQKKSKPPEAAQEWKGLAEDSAVAEESAVITEAPTIQQVEPVNAGATIEEVPAEMVKEQEPRREEAAPVQPVAREATKVPVLKKQEMKKKKPVSEAVQRPVPPVAQTEERDSRAIPVLSARAGQNEAAVNFQAQVENLARKQQIASLHTKAREAMQQGRLIQPPEQSAQAYLNEILFLDPTDNQAVEGLKLICEKYSSLAEESLAAKQFGRAEDYVADGLSVIPNYRRLMDIKKRIEPERQEHIFELSEKARLCLEANKLSTPANDSAYYYYNEIAQLDPESGVVRKGMKDIADGYAKMAEEAFRDFDYKMAEVYVRRGLQIVPDHYYLLSLNEELGRSDLGRFGHSMKKKLNRLLSE